MDKRIRDETRPNLTMEGTIKDPADDGFRGAATVASGEYEVVVSMALSESWPWQ